MKSRKITKIPFKKVLFKLRAKDFKKLAKKIGNKNDKFQMVRKK